MQTQTRTARCRNCDRAYIRGPKDGHYCRRNVCQEARRERKKEPKTHRPCVCGEMVVAGFRVYFPFLNSGTRRRMDIIYVCANCLELERKFGEPEITKRWCLDCGKPCGLRERCDKHAG